MLKVNVMWSSKLWQICWDWSFNLSMQKQLDLFGSIWRYYISVYSCSMKVALFIDGLNKSVSIRSAVHISEFNLHFLFWNKTFSIFIVYILCVTRVSWRWEAKILRTGEINITSVQNWVSQINTGPSYFYGLQRRQIINQGLPPPIFLVQFRPFKLRGEKKPLAHLPPEVSLKN